MHSIISCRNRLLCPALLGLLLSLWAVSVQAVTLNFSARLVPGTCTFNLSRSTVSLGTLIVSSFQPSTLVGTQPFSLSVTNCNGTDASLTPVVSITGDGVTQSGRWLFRATDSRPDGVGVMLVHTDVMPTYSSTEVRSGDTLPLAAQGANPLDQTLSFYVGATCGSQVGTCEAIGSGGLVARILFSLDYL